MSREKHRHTKKHHKDATNENENTDERLKNQLFTETDAKSVEISGYTVGRGAPQTQQLMQEHAIPTGVVDIDESVQLPISPSKSRYQHHDSKPYATLRSSENKHQEHVHLPPISRHSHHHDQHHPYGYVYPSPDYYPVGHLSHPYPVYYEHHSPHQHRHHHHHHHRRRHHKHKKEVETYDPRWWYMPINSVHRPRPWRPPEYHYVPPKWYETPRSQSKILTMSPESKPSPQKYIDCRCEVCRPSKETSRGIKWIVNE